MSFLGGPTRQVQPGDTPDLNDGLLSRKMTANPGVSQTRTRGFAYVLVKGTGLVEVATDARVKSGDAPFVPIESVTADAVGSASAVSEPISGVVAPQRIALTFEANTALGLELFPGDYVMVDDTLATGNVGKWTLGATSTNPKYARFLGIEAALLEKNTVSPFDETLSPGIVPDEGITDLATGETAVGWFQIVENFL